MKARIQEIICWGVGRQRGATAAKQMGEEGLCYEISGFCHGAVEVFSLLGHYAALVGS
jgi:hypothetical protein